MESSERSFGLVALRCAVLGLAVWGCGESSPGGVVTPPPPPPTVASVDVSPGTANLTVGDSISLTATARTASGVAVSGTVVTWTSSAPSVATVSATGSVTAFGAGSADVSATVDGKSGTARLTVVRLQLESGRAQFAVIGPAGGRVSATRATGVTYELVVPPGALDTATRITLTPVSALGVLRVSGGTAGAVDLQPSGLRFHRPASFFVRGATTAQGAFRLAGLSWKGSGDSVRLQPATRVGADYHLLVTHFSGAAVVFATPQELQSLPLPPASAAQDSALLALAGLALPADRAAIEAALRQWQLAVVARLQLAQNDVQVRDAVAEADTWLATLASYPGTDGAQLRVALALERGTVRTIMAAALRRGILFANQQCLQQRSLVWARNAMVLHLGAQYDSLDTPGSGLERAVVKQGLCVQPVVVDSLFDLAPQVDSTRAYDLRFGLRYGTPTLAVDSIRYRLQFDIHGTRFDRALADTTDAQGRYSLALGAAPADSLHVLTVACVDSAVVLVTDHCLSFRMVRGRTVFGPLLVQTPAQLAALRGVSRVVGSLWVNGAPSTDLADLSSLREVTGGLALTGMPQLTSLAGLRGLQRVGGSLNISGTPLLHLNDLSQVVIAPSASGLDQVAFYNNAQLTSLSGGPRPGPGWKGSIVVDGNPRLSDLAMFQGLVEAGGLTLRWNDLLSNLNDLLALQRIRGGAHFEGGGFSQISLPAVTAIGGGVSVSLDAARSLALVSMPALRVADFVDFRAFQRLGCGRTAPIIAQFPVLDSVRVFGVFPDLADCPLNLEAPQLRVVVGASTAGVVNLSGASLRSVVLGNVAVRGGSTAQFTVDAPNLTSLTLGRLDLDAPFRLVNTKSLAVLTGPPGQRFGGGVFIGGNTGLQTISGMAGSTVVGDLQVGSNPFLTTLSGWNGSTVTGTIRVQSNIRLSTQLATAWAAAMTAASRFIAGNLIP